MEFTLFCCRYHLQALRHFYVLATEPRVLVTRECDTGQSCSVPVEIHVQVEVGPHTFVFSNDLIFFF